MAFPIFQIIGQIAGAYFGPIGSAIGGAVGGAIDRGIAPTPEITGPALTDLKVQISSYGSSIPILIGKKRVTMNIIDGSDKRQIGVETNQIQGTKVKTIKYGVDLAGMVGEPPIGWRFLGLTRMWANGTRIYEIGTNSALGDVLASSTNLGGGDFFTGNLGADPTGRTGFGPPFRFYLGTDTQMPDPTLESLNGVGNVPGYRGIGYIVLPGLDITSFFGNRIPDLEIEYVCAPSGSSPITNRKWQQGPAIAGYPGWGVPYLPPGDELIVLAMRIALSTLHIDVVSITPTTQTVLSTFTPGDQYPYLMGFAGSADEVGQLIEWRLADLYNTNSGALRWFRQDGSYTAFTQANLRFTAAFSAAEGAYKLFYSKRGDYMLLLNTHTTGTLPTSVVLCSCGPQLGALIATHDFTLGANETIEAVMLASTFAWVATWDSSTTTTRLYKLSLPDLTFVASYTYLASATIPGASGLTYQKLFPHNTSYAIWTQVSFGAGDDIYLFLSDTTQRAYRLLLLAGDGSISEILADALSVTSGAGLNPDIAAHQLSLSGFSYLNGVLTSLAYYSNLPASYYYWPYTAFVAVDPDDAIVADMQRDICLRDGLDDSEFDVSELTDPLRGFGVADVMPGRTASEPMMAVFGYGACESDGKIKFRKRGAAAVADIPFDDLCAHQYGAEMPEPFPMVRKQEAEMPRTITLNYTDAVADYQIGSALSRRVVTTAVSDVVINSPVVMSPAEAASVADFWMYDGWASRNSRKFSLLRKWVWLDATDVVRIEYPRGIWTRVRLLMIKDTGIVLDIDAVEDDAGALITNSVAAGSPSTLESIGKPPPSYAVFLDIPILADLDNNSGFYAPIPRPSATWEGATVYRSSDNITYDQIGAVVDTGATTGLCTTTLGNWTGGNVFDWTNTLTVTLSDTAAVLTSATRDQVLDQGANLCAVGSDGAWEMIQFMTATWVSGTTYVLSGLLRGRKGTEWAIGGHVAGENFWWTGDTDVPRPDEGSVAIGSTRYYKTVSFGRSLNQTFSQQFTNSAVGLKPYAPVNLRGARDASGNLSLTLDRRTRLDPEVYGAAVEIQLGEVSELYDLEIYSSSAYTTVKRVLNDVPPTALLYSAANQVIDFGSNQATVYVKVYQKSAVVGRGYPVSGGV